MTERGQRAGSPTGGQCELLNSSNATTGGTHATTQSAHHHPEHGHAGPVGHRGTRLLGHRAHRTHSARGSDGSDAFRDSKRCSKEVVDAFDAAAGQPGRPQIAIWVLSPRLVTSISSQSLEHLTSANVGPGNWASTDSQPEWAGTHGGMKRSISDPLPCYRFSSCLRTVGKRLTQIWPLHIAAQVFWAHGARGLGRNAQAKPLAQLLPNRSRLAQVANSGAATGSEGCLSLTVQPIQVSE